MSETIETRQVRDALRMAQSVLDSLETGPIGQLVGESGTGKTRAGKYLVEHLGAVRVCCAQGISNKVLAAKIHAAFGGESAPGSANTLIGRLESLVAGRLLVVDEANHLRWQQLELLRYLADEAGMGLILVGTDLMDRPFKDGRTATFLAQLASRIGAKRVRFEPLSALEEVAGYMLQPHFGKVDKATAAAFHKQAKGYWRDAAELAAACRRVLAAQNLERLSPVVVEAASNWMAPARLAA
ncbi:AAA family ATPase [Aromatoleum toluvorans]|uniref:AAA family ATPase n=1 Tax=Aromatoleum toluvorans TaxID=92002 RepID=A0ABX1Q3V4_9RHOO|nr:ATP-binding protein [Aromatoleum toluvorans]NMG46409.1 AAA family ATPase [Aromatoleum toluvorans]